MCLIKETAIINSTDIIINSKENTSFFKSLSSLDNKCMFMDKYENIVWVSNFRPQALHRAYPLASVFYQYFFIRISLASAFYPFL